MASWDEKKGRVSRAFDEWKLIDGDQRAFLRLGLEFATSEYDRLWKESEQEPYYEGGPELIDSFEAKVDTLHQHDFDWMFLAGVLRDAVTSFEVYLEKARDRGLGRVEVEPDDVSHLVDELRIGRKLERPLCGAA